MRVPSTLNKQYSNLYEGESNAFEGLLERFESSDDDEEGFGDSVPIKEQEEVK